MRSSAKLEPTLFHSFRNGFRRTIRTIHKRLAARGSVPSNAAFSFAETEAINSP
jgi:hypothetical protein